MRALRKVLLMATGLALAACGDAGEAALLPGASELVVSIEAHGAPAGAVLLEIRGPDMQTPVPARDGRIVHARQVEPDTWRVTVAGDELRGELVRFGVTAATSPDAYSVYLLEAAGTDNDVLPVDEFRVAMERVD